MQEIATPATPATGFGRLYTTTDGSLHFLNDLGDDRYLNRCSYVREFKDFVGSVDIPSGLTFIRITMWGGGGGGGNSNAAGDGGGGGGAGCAVIGIVRRVEPGVGVITLQVSSTGGSAGNAASPTIFNYAGGASTDAFTISARSGGPGGNGTTNMGGGGGGGGGTWTNGIRGNFNIDGQGGPGGAAATSYQQNLIKGPTGAFGGSTVPSAVGGDGNEGDFTGTVVSGSSGAAGGAAGFGGGTGGANYGGLGGGTAGDGGGGAAGFGGIGGVGGLGNGSDAPLNSGSGGGGAGGSNGVGGTGGGGYILLEFC